MNFEKIFYVGLHKTGTTSFHRFLLNAGLSSVHCPGHFEGTDYQKLVDAAGDDDERILDCFQPLLRRFTGFSDVPIAGVYKGLAQRYPTAKFVMFTRDLNDWWRSLHQHWSLAVVSRCLSPFERAQYKNYLGFDRQFIRACDRTTMIEAHVRHISEVRSFLTGREFLDVDLKDPQVGPKLAHFLKLPDAALPREKLMNPLLRTKRIFKNVSQRFASST